MNVKALLEDDFQIPVASQILILNGISISDDSKSLKDFNVKQDDVIMVALHNQIQQTAQPSVNQAERARAQINSDPNLKRQFLQVSLLIE